MPLPTDNPATQALAAGDIHTSTLVIDTHADTPQRFVDEGWDFLGPLATPENPAGMLNLASARAGNLAAEFFAIWPEPTEWVGRYAHRTLSLIDAVREQVRRHPAELELCVSPQEILAAHAAGRFAVLMGIEGGHAIENSLALLRNYYALGVRYMTLTWANSNDWAESSTDLRDESDLTVPHRTAGLTPFGIQVVEEMNRLGMMVDVSHSSDRTFADVLTATRAPILATHSSARALTNSPRNLTDDQLRALAANGGVCMVNFYSAFIDEDYRRAWGAQRQERSAAHAALAESYAERNQPVPFHVANRLDREFAARIPRPPLASLIDHFDHILRVAGADHVGIGTDFDGISSLPQEIDSAADLPKISAALLARGHSVEDLRKVLGGNLMRVFAAARSFADSE
ncbi:MAG TPA: dipeptidase [Acidobacteriaceae bacterium]|nr:dipeptidase [Acidobacteriaceae bacterium]